jgi:formamidopyrimidine-DNA glycosylase
MLYSQSKTVPSISELGPHALFEPMSVGNFLDSLDRKKIGMNSLVQLIFLIFSYLKCIHFIF